MTLKEVVHRTDTINFSQAVHVYAKEHDIPHIWNVDDHAHDGDTWGSNLFQFTQRIFR
jgi:hypothetical protein